MTDWKPGDRFKLECEGTVGLHGQDSVGVWTELDDRWTELDDSKVPRRFGLAWFDAHATKIRRPQRPLKFGDCVVIADSTLVYRVLGNWKVEGGYQDSDDLVLIWPVGLEHTAQVRRADLTLIEPLDDD